MKILTVCDQGNNRSVNLAGRLKYWGNDVLSAGLLTNSPATLEMLFDWADKIIITAKDQILPVKYWGKIMLFNIGADIYPRPYNKELDDLVKQFLELNKNILKNVV